MTAAPVLAGSRLRVQLPARFLGWSAVLPAGRITNADLTTRMDTDDAWIVERTGIHERRVAGAQDTTASLATEAGRRALERAGASAADVDLVILATTTADRVCPATAATVQDALGTRGAAFDLNAACAGFVHALHVAAATLTTPGVDLVLVIGAERLTSIVDPADRGTAILFGDGAGALVLGSVDDADATAREHGPGLLSVDLGGDGSGVPHLWVPPGRPYLHMDGQEIFRRATRGIAESCHAALERAGATGDDVDLFVPHQANVRIIEAAAHRLGVPAEKVMVNIDSYGNTSAASVPIALAEAAESGRLVDGSHVLTCGIGAGMAWATSLLRWGR